MSFPCRTKAVVLAAAIASLAPTAHAALTNVTWLAGTGSWTAASKWSTNSVPNDGTPAADSTYAVTIDNSSATTSSVTLPNFNTIHVASLTLTSPDSLTLAAGAKLTTPLLTNNGTLTIGSSSSYTASLTLDGPTPTLAGAGTIALAGGTFSTTSAATGPLAVPATATISGYGTLSQLSFNNAGVIDANTPAKNLLLNLTGPSTNSGTLQASAGYLGIGGGSLTLSGSLAAYPGASVGISSPITLSPGAVVNAAGGSISLSVPLTLNSDHALALSPGSYFSAPSLNLNGYSLSLTSAAGALLAPVILTKPNTILSTNARLTVTTVDNTNGSLQLSGTSVATLYGTFTNTNGTLSLADSATLSLSGNSTLTGGTVSTSGSASVNASGAFYYSAPTLSNLTLNGTANISTNAILSGTLTVNGSLNIQPGYQYVRPTGLDLQGTGVTAFQYGDLEPLVATTGTYTLTVHPGHTVRGVGNLFYDVAGNQSPVLVNQGTIESADPSSAGNSFSLGGTRVSNTGTLRATPGSELYFRTSTFTSTGTVDVQPAATLRLTSEGGSNGTYTLSSLSTAGTTEISSTTASVDSLTGPGTVHVYYFGALRARDLDVGTLSVEWPGSVTLTPQPAQHAARTANLVFPSANGSIGGLLDITNQALVIDYPAGATSPYDDLAPRLAKAFNSSSGRWRVSATSTNTITSSTAADDNAANRPTAVAMAEASTLFGPTTSHPFLNQPTDPTTLILLYTLSGDANLDGQITPDDYALLDKNFALHTPNAHWTDGDFNYDRIVDQNDYLLIDTALYSQSHSFSPNFLSERESQFGEAYVQQLLASVPEPTSLAACGLAALLLPRRRRATP